VVVVASAWGASWDPEREGEGGCRCSFETCSLSLSLLCACSHAHALLFIQVTISKKGIIDWCVWVLLVV
jgi:hypothetical protein